MAEKSLKVLIAGRTYPLTVKEEEEEVVMTIAKTINDKMKEFEQNYSVRDKQDLLAMCALNLLTSLHNTSQQSREAEETLINQLDLFVSDFLQKQQSATNN